MLQAMKENANVALDSHTASGCSHLPIDQPFPALHICAINKLP